MADSPKGPHVLVFPHPAQGHMLPLLDLTHQLALHNLAITIIITPKNLPFLNPLLSLHPSIQTQIFPFPDHPSIPPGVENVKDIGNRGQAPMVAALSGLRGPIIQWFKSHHNPPVALLSDFFLGWTHDLANEIGIPRVAFYSSGAFLTAVFHHIWGNLEAVREFSVVDFTDLPRSPSFTREHLPSLFLRYRESEPSWQIVKDGIIANFSSWASVFNTIDGLEAEYLDYLKKIMGHGRIFAVGPLNLVGVPDRSAHDSALSVANNGIMQWLDQCPDGSVLYVCFGSQKILKQAQVDALAIGLEQSGVHFIWVVRPITAQQLADGYGTLPDGFEKRVSGRGLIVKGWAPQVSILAHRAVSGFLSHCGWNSVLEAIVAGVMILGWPMEAEQFVNARLMVDYLGAAVRVAEGTDTVPDSALLAKVIGESIGKDIIEIIRAKELQSTALKAIGNGGSSRKDIDGLVNELSQLQVGP